MTDKELQDLIGLKKYEQPEETYFDDFLVEFQQRQRAEMLTTSARSLLFERARARFSEFGSLRWVIGVGAAYAAIVFSFYLIPNKKAEESVVKSPTIEGGSIIEGNIPDQSLSEEDASQLSTLSMSFTEPVDFTEPAPAFSTDERFF